MLTAFISPTINHLLTQNSWALAELKAYSDQHLRIVFPVGAASFSPLASGFLNSAAPKTPPNASINLTLAQFIRLISSNFSDTRALQIDGDADFAFAILKILKGLRWDAAEDLSRIFGDVLAERAVNSAGALLAWPKSVANNLAQTSAEFLQEEVFFLARPPEVHQWIKEVDVLRDSVARLDKRLARLENSIT